MGSHIKNYIMTINFECKLLINCNHVRSTTVDSLPRLLDYSCRRSRKAGSESTYTGEKLPAGCDRAKLLGQLRWDPPQAATKVQAEPDRISNTGYHEISWSPKVRGPLITINDLLSHSLPAFEPLSAGAPMTLEVLHKGGPRVSQRSWPRSSWPSSSGRPAQPFAHPH